MGQRILEMGAIPELGIIRDYEELELPPGFRFHPTDEELITHYLCPKVLESSFSARAIGEVDLNKVEPWDLPWKAKMGEREWYFFCVRDRKYPTGLRTNRATEAGYWKATGKDKEIYRVKTLIGMKKTLVFYRGRAPRGEKTNWVMHEFRLEGNGSLCHPPKTARNEWVISRIFHKSSGGKKVHISGLIKISSQGNALPKASNLPPLMDCSAQDNETRTLISSPHVTCFSDHSEDIKPHENTVHQSHLFPVSSVWDSLFSAQFLPNVENLQYQEPAMAQDQSILSILLQNNDMNMKRNFKTEFSADTWMSTSKSSAFLSQEVGPGCYDDQGDLITSAGPVDIACLWNY